MENNSNDGNHCCYGGRGFRHFRWFGKAALLTLSLFLLAATIKEFKSVSYVGRDTPAVTTISVSGTGDVVAVPDIATFDYSVEEKAATVADAQTAATKKANAISDFLKQSGVADKDVKTVGYNIYPNYVYNGTVCPVSASYCPPVGKQILDGYTVSQTTEVKVRNTSDAGKILSGVGPLGATNLSGLNFSFDNDEGLKAEARGKAIDDAKSKAVELARELGVRLARIVSFNEEGVYPPVYYAKSAVLGMGGGAASAPTPDISVGENKITSNVTITYEIE